MKREYFEKKLKEFKDKYDEEKRKSSLHGYLRVVLLVGAVFFLYKFYEGHIEKKYLFLVLSAILGSAFVIVVLKSIKAKKKIKWLQNRMYVAQRFIHRFDGEWVEFTEDGNEFIDKKHRYSSDLDIFGKKSLFQFINSTATAMGRRKLAEALKGDAISIDNINRRNSWIEELHLDIELCEELAYGNQEVQDIKSIEIFKTYIREKNKTFKKLNIRHFLNIMICIDAGVVFTALQMNNKSRMVVLISLGLIHAFLTTAAFFKADNILSEMKSFLKGIKRYEEIAGILKERKFKTESLKVVHKELFYEKENFYTCLKKLDGIEQKINMRGNIGTFIIYNIILLGDFRWILALEEWRERYRGEFELWLDYLAEIEVVVSLSVIPQVIEDTVKPEISAEKVELQFEKLAHPLISEKDVVGNDGSISKKIMVITGSNMSGKTTFLRTIGINLVLAYAGGMVCAKKMKCSIMDIFTSMRIEDDLNEGLSTFYYELKRIKGIIEFSKIEKPMLFLIDEIFRGTNSKDRIIGAQGVMHGLNKPWIIGGITTHDFELCLLEENTGEKVTNMHFEERYEADGIKFDYKIKFGKATTANAQYLMKLVGIDIDE